MLGEGVWGSVLAQELTQTFYDRSSQPLSSASSYSVAAWARSDGLRWWSLRRACRSCQSRNLVATV